MNVSEQYRLAISIPRGEQIALLNDKLRETGEGGRIVVTSGVSALPGYDTATLLLAVSQFDQFDIDNDPHGERDFGDAVYAGSELLWKIDYYDNALEYGSPDPADPNVTTRVLTIMLAEEY